MYPITESLTYVPLLVHPLTHVPTHPLTHSRTPPRSPTHSRTHPPSQVPLLIYASLTYLHTHSLTHLPLIRAPTHSFTHLPPQSRVSHPCTSSLTQVPTYRFTYVSLTHLSPHPRILSLIHKSPTRRHTSSLICSPEKPLTRKLTHACTSVDQSLVKFIGPAHLAVYQHLKFCSSIDPGVLHVTSHFFTNSLAYLLTRVHSLLMGPLHL